jgi:hypothetical protein
MYAYIHTYIHACASEREKLGLFTLRGEHRLRVFENRVLRRIFGLRRDEVTVVWRKLDNEELHNLHYSPGLIRMIKSRRMVRWVGYISRMGEKRIAYRVLSGKPEGTRPLGRQRYRCMDNIKIKPIEIRWGGVHWIDLAHNKDQRRAL